MRPLSRRLPAIPALNQGTATVFVLLLASWTLVRTAWVCDDAYISFRVVDNLVNGYGLRWNVDERLQTFSNPLWVLLLAPGYALTGEIYYTTLALSGLASLGTLWVILRQSSRSVGANTIAALSLALSPTFIEFSTSGLENTLTHLFVALFCARYFHDDASPERKMGVLTLLAALAAVNRLDNALLLGIPLGAFALRHRTARVLRAALYGALPLIAWEVFSLVYYGLLVPNTAYAKLATGIPTHELLAQGLTYLGVSAQFDPIGACLLVIALAVTPFLDRRLVSIALGVAAQIVYVALVGGDFMSGRFLSAPIVAAAALIAQALSGPKAEIRRNAIIVLCFGLLVAVPLTAQRTVASSRLFTRPDLELPTHGIIDEREFYYRATGLLSPYRTEPMTHPLRESGLLSPHRTDPMTHSLRESGRHVLVGQAFMGFLGFNSDPRVHIIDTYALCDPLLARLPTNRPWRIGHFERDLPQGYKESLESGKNSVADPDLARLYDVLVRVTRGPLFGAERWRAIISLNFGEASQLARYSRHAAGIACKDSQGTDLAACRRSEGR